MYEGEQNNEYWKKISKSYTLLLIPYGVGGKTSSIQTIAEELMKTKNDMDEILSKHTGQSREKLDEITKHDCIFKGKEAVEFGLADGIMGLTEMLSRTA